MEAGRDFLGAEALLVLMVSGEPDSGLHCGMHPSRRVGGGGRVGESGVTGDRPHLAVRR